MLYENRKKGDRLMELKPPFEQYVTGAQATHCSRKRLANQVGLKEEELTIKLMKAGYWTFEGKVTKKAQTDGLVDTCEGRVLWSVVKVKSFLKELEKPAPVQAGPKWVDLGTVGTYFGVSNVVIGKWLDQLKLRAKPTVEKNESGDYDMLDMANIAKQEQANGFIGKEPTEKALEMGLARKLTVTNRKQKEIEIVQWNLDLCKTVLVKAGHQLDLDHKIALKGKGRNSNVQVNGIEKRAKELYVEWAKLYGDPNQRWRIEALFKGQPTKLLEKVETDYMKMPGYLSSGRYLKDC